MTTLLLALLFTCHVSDISAANRSVSVSCQIPATARTRIKFRESFAGIEKLYERVYSPRVRDKAGNAITLELRGNGNYAFTPPNDGLVQFTYTMKFDRLLEPSQYPLISGIGPDGGQLLPLDLIPEFTLEASPGEPFKLDNLTVEAPPGWLVSSIDKSAYVVGKIRPGKHAAITGLWSFDDEYFGKLVESIAAEQARMIEASSPQDYLVSLAPFPLPLTGLRSAALARGRTVVLMFNRGPDEARSRAHLERHVAHEMFHFYLPNAFQVRDNFDWFWEGFTRYVGMLTLVQMKALTFNEFLNQLLLEYDAYRVNPSRNEMSLVAASPEKFSSAANYEIVYRKGLIVAALYDLELRWQSRGKNRLTKVIGGLYREYGVTNREIGNREVIDALKKAGELSQQISEDVEGTREIDLLKRLEKYGIGLDRRAKLVVNENLSSRQKELINQF